MPRRISGRLTLQDRLAVCVAVLPLLISIGVLRADEPADPCDTYAKELICDEASGSAGCASHKDEMSCEASFETYLKLGKFKCFTSANVNSKCLPLLDEWGEPLLGVCYEEWACEWNPVGGTCNKSYIHEKHYTGIYFTEQCKNP